MGVEADSSEESEDEGGVEVEGEEANVADGWESMGED